MPISFENWETGTCNGTGFSLDWSSPAAIRGCRITEYAAALYQAIYERCAVVGSTALVREGQTGSPHTPVPPSPCVLRGNFGMASYSEGVYLGVLQNALPTSAWYLTSASENGGIAPITGLPQIPGALQPSGDYQFLPPNWQEDQPPIPSYPVGPGMPPAELAYNTYERANRCTKLVVPLQIVQSYSRRYTYEKYESYRYPDLVIDPGTDTGWQPSTPDIPMLAYNSTIQFWPYSGGGSSCSGTKRWVKLDILRRKTLFRYTPPSPPVTDFSGTPIDATLTYLTTSGTVGSDYFPEYGEEENKLWAFSPECNNTPVNWGTPIEFWVGDLDDMLTAIPPDPPPGAAVVTQKGWTLRRLRTPTGNHTSALEALLECDFKFKKT